MLFRSFPAIQRLLKAYPTWAWANFRFAYAALFLEDLKMAARYFQAAKDLVAGTDDIFDTWLASFKAQVEVSCSLCLCLAEKFILL